MTPAQLCLEQAKEKPGEELEVIKNSKSRATTFAKELRDVGLQAGTRVWHADSGTRYRVWYKLPLEPRDDLTGIDEHWTLDHQALLDQVSPTPKPGSKIVGISTAGGQSHWWSKTPAGSPSPDLVTANTLQEAIDYCREQGWNTNLACNKHDQLEVKHRLAMVIGKANVVEL